MADMILTSHQLSKTSETKYLYYIEISKCFTLLRINKRPVADIFLYSGPRFQEC